MTLTLLLLELLTIQPATAVRNTPDPSTLTAAYAEAFNANDAAQLAGLFADDTVLMPPDHPTIRGRDAVEAAYRARFTKMRLGQLRMQTLDFEARSDRATAVGTFSLSIGDPEGALATGKYIVIYKRVQDAWLIAYQIMNYDSPR